MYSKLSQLNAHLEPDKIRSVHFPSCTHTFETKICQAAYLHMYIISCMFVHKHQLISWAYIPFAGNIFSIDSRSPWMFGQTNIHHSPMLGISHSMALRGMWTWKGLALFQWPGGRVWDEQSTKTWWPYMVSRHVKPSLVSDHRRTYNPQIYKGL